MYALINNNNLKSSSGFSILEAIIATAVLVLALIAIIGVIPAVLQINKKTELATIAISYARSSMEETLTKNYDDILVYSGAPTRLSANQNDPLYQLEREIVINYVDSNMNTVIVPPATDIGLKKITITMYWPNRQGGKHTLALTSLLSKK